MQASLIKRYGRAGAKWVVAGRPKRTDHEVRRLLAICKACQPHYKPRGDDEGTCGLCGCRLAIGGPAFRNKIRMGTEHCPMGLWCLWGFFVWGWLRHAM